MYRIVVVTTQVVLSVGSILANCSSLCLASNTSVAPFVGVLQESWEQFERYRRPGPDNFLLNPTTIFNGNASYSNSKIGVFQKDTSSGYNLVTSGHARPVDGVKGVGNGNDTPTIITFSKPVIKFGGYWGAVTERLSDPALIEFEFFNVNGILVGSDSVLYSRSFTTDEGEGIFLADGVLAWAGWHFDSPVGKIIVSGDFVANDFLQANTIPEPNSLAIAALGIVLGIDRRARGGLR